MEWRIPRYPRLSAEAVSFANSLNRRGAHHLAISGGAQPYTLSPSCAARSLGFAVHFECRANGQALRLGLDAGLCDWLLSGWLPLSDVVALDDELRQSVFVAALAPLADFWQQHSGGSFSVAAVDCESSAAPQSSVFFDLSAASGAGVGQAYVVADAALREALQCAWCAAAKASPALAAAALPVWVEVVVGRATLSLQQLRGLQADDIILLGVAFAKTRHVHAIIGDTLCFSSVIDEGKLVIRQRVGGTMANNEQSTTDQLAIEQSPLNPESDNQSAAAE